jgi:hypothetical protein
MKPLSEKFKREWTFFINPRTQKVQYNKKCLSCVHNDCKQSYRARVVACKNYEKKAGEI